MSGIFFIADLDRKILFLSKEGREIFDVNENQNLNFDFLTLFKGDEIPKIKNSIDTIQINETKSINAIETEINNRKFNQRVFLNLEVLNIKGQEFSHIVGLINLKPENQSQILSQKILAEEFIENIPLGVYRTGIDGTVHYANREMANIFGFEDLDEFYEVKINELFVDLQDRSYLLKNCFSGETFSFELQTYTKNKEIIWIKDSCRMVFDIEGKAQYLDGVIENITIKKINEQRLIQSENQLKELNLTKDKFFSIISHDLRSPFNQIIGATELLLTKLDEYDKEMIRKFLTLLNEEAIKSYRLLENLLQWSKNQRGLISFDPKPLSVVRIINDILNIFGKIADHKKISIFVEVKPDLHVYADKEMILTTLRNLVSNAIKFTGENGEIIISASEKMDFDICQSFIEFNVSDNGIGINETQIQKLFSLTENYSSKGTYNETGTGLGLLLCKEFVEKHNGKIWVESKPGEGSNFKFCIPN
jgi:PAS domain S-box-containing protein